DRDREAFERRDGVEIHRYPAHPATGGPVGYAREYASALWHTRRLVRRLARERRFDVVHACNPPDLLLLAAWPLKRRGTALVFDHALRALAALREKRDDWRAVFVGDGDALPELRRLAEELGLDGSVDFAGWQDDVGVRRVLASADVCLSPEPRSPLNDASTMIKVAEYMAMGKPVACYDLVESRATAGDAAVYARPNDERALAVAISQLLDDPQRRAAMGAYGRAPGEQTLAWVHSERTLLSAYERAVTRPRRARGWMRSRPSVSALRTSGHGRHGGDGTVETSTASSRSSAS